MAKQTINIGTVANDGTGTTLRDGGDLINDNFNEIYTAIGDGTTLNSNILTASSTDTLTNKTIDTANNTITIAEADISDLGAYITASSSDTLTNKTISGSSNTLSNIANSSLSNSSITFAGDSGSDGISLGGTITVAGGTNITTTFSSGTLTIDAAASGLASVVQDTTPQLGGTLDTNGNPIQFGDNDKAQFGASQDLEIYHDGTSSRIVDKGTGNLFLYGSSVMGFYNDISALEAYAIFNNNGSVDLYYDNSKKFETTSTGATVTGDLSITGNLTVNGTTTTLNATNTTITDNLLELNSGSASNANDSGIIIERGSTGDNAIIAWDESADKFILGTTTNTASDTGNLAISSGTLVANLEGNADTSTALATGRTIGMTGDVVWTSTSFDGTGNVTGTSTIQSGTISSTELASASTLLIKNSAGTTVKTIIGAGV